MADARGNQDRSGVLQRRSQGGTGGAHLGPMRLTPFRIVIGLAFLGSAAFIAFAIVFVRDARQIPMLSSGFAVLGLASASIALALVIELWRSASRGNSGRALALAVLGGIVGLAAIGCFTLTVLLALLWGSS